MINKQNDVTLLYFALLMLLVMFIVMMNLTTKLMTLDMPITPIIGLLLIEIGITLFLCFLILKEINSEIKSNRG